MPGDRDQPKWRGTGTSLQKDKKTVIRQLDHTFRVIGISRRLFVSRQIGYKKRRTQSIPNTVARLRAKKRRIY